MKKQKMKNYLKTGTLLLGISFFLLNCEKDNTFNETQILKKDNTLIFKKLLETAKFKEESFNRIAKAKTNVDGMEGKGIDATFKSTYGTPTYNKTINLINEVGKPILVIPLKDSNEKITNLLIGYVNEGVENYRILNESLKEGNLISVNRSSTNPCPTTRIGNRMLGGLFKYANEIQDGNYDFPEFPDISGLGDGCYEWDGDTSCWCFSEVDCPSGGGGGGSGNGSGGSGGSSGGGSGSGGGTGGGSGGGPPNGGGSGGGSSNGGSGSGSGSGGSSGNSSAINCGELPFDTTTPCEQLSKASLEKSFVETMKDLDIKSTTLENEVGYIQVPSSTNIGNDYTPANVDSDSGEVIWDIPFSTSVTGMYHTHYDTETQLSVFSSDDLYALFSLFDPVFDTSGNVTFNNPHNIDKNFTYILVTAHGTKLAIKFNGDDSIEKLREFGEKYFGDWNIDTSGIPQVPGITPETDRERFQAKYEKFVNKKFSIEKQKKKFAKFLDKVNLGVSLFQATNDTFTQWEKINKTGNTTPCN